MKDQWTKINEIQRRYRMPDGSEVIIDNPSALFISKSRTHYLSNEDDTERCIVPWPFHSIHSEVAESEDWVFPPPRFMTYEPSGPWAVSDVFKKDQE